MEEVVAVRRVDDRIRREAKVVGLGELDVPTLESSERRRLVLWVVMSDVLVTVSLAFLLTTLWSDGPSLGLRSVAEGVESASQAEQLTRIGRDLAQGYYWSRPLAPEDLDRWLDHYGVMALTPSG